MTSPRSAILAAAALATLLVATVATGRSTAAARPCVPASIHHGAPPSWTAAAWADSSGLQPPYALASGNAAAAFFFAPLLRAGHPTNPTNKILWIVRYPRDGTPLRITARAAGASASTVHLSFPDNASPGEIYPSIVDLPKAGCWALTLHWSTHVATMDVQVHALRHAAHAPDRATAAHLARHARIWAIAVAGRHGPRTRTARAARALGR